MSDMASWHHEHKVPLWIDFIHSSHWKKGMLYKHLRPQNTAFEIPLEGDMCITLNENMRIVRPGELLILPAGDENDLQAGPSGFCRKLSFGFTGPLTVYLLPLMHLENDRIHRLKDIDVLHKLIDEARRLLRGKHEEDIPRICGLAIEILTLISMQASPAENPLISDALRIFEFNISREISLAETAGELGVSQEKLIAAFRKRFGTSPKQYLIRLRMEKAEIMLKNSSESIKNIASRTGYGAICRFSREFKKKHGISPSEFRKTFRAD